MAILRNTGLPQVNALPVDAPTTNGPRFVQLEDSNTFGYWDGAAWNEITIGDDTAYNATTWNGNLNVPTMNAIRDKIEAMIVSTLSDGDYGDVTVSGSGTVFTIDNGLAATKIADGSVSNTEFQYLSTVTSNVQTQLDAKANETEVVHDTGNESIAGIKTFTDDPIVPAEAYGVGWNGSNEVPTKNDVYDEMELRALDSAVVHDTGAEVIAGVKTFSSDPLIPDEAYGVGWNGSLEPPTKNALWDKIEVITTASPSLIYKAIIAQSGTGIPTATILLNTLGEVPTFVRNTDGDYELNTVAGIFLTNKTLVHATISTGSVAAIVRAGIGVAVTEVAFKTFDAADAGVDLVGTMNLTIEVFP